MKSCQALIKQSTHKRKEKKERNGQEGTTRVHATSTKNKGNMNKSNTQNPLVARRMSNKVRGRTPKGNT